MGRWYQVIAAAPDTLGATLEIAMEGYVDLHAEGGTVGSVRVAVGVALVPGPGDGDDVFEAGVSGFPAEFAYGLFR